MESGLQEHHLPFIGSSQSQLLGLKAIDSATSTFSQGSAASGQVARSRLQHQLDQQRYAPYSCPAQSTPRSSSSSQQRLPAAMQQDAQDPGPCSSGAVQRRPLMLQLAISMANTALEATLQHFNQACSAAPGSAAALAALDAAEAAMAQTTRMTGIASVLAKKCMQDATPGADAAPAACIPVLQHAQHLGLQLSNRVGAQLLQPGFAVAGALPVAMPGALLLQQQQTEDVEDGEEVSSSCRSSTSEILMQMQSL